MLKNKKAKYKKNITVLGSGSWSTTMAKIIATNVTHSESYESKVILWVEEEIINGEKLTDIVNTRHENVKYLSGIKLPENVVAEPDAVESIKKSDIIVFAVSAKILPLLSSRLQGLIKPTAIGLSLINGLILDVDFEEKPRIELISNMLRKQLKISIAVLTGANVVTEVANEQFSETTIGCQDKRMGETLKELIQTDYFYVEVVDDIECVEVCGALKDIVSVGVGFADGLKLGNNVKAAISRIGFTEMIKFVDTFYPGSHVATLYESSGLGNLICSCYYEDDNNKVAKDCVTFGKSIEELENEMLDGQHIQGPITAAIVNHLLRSKEIENNFPLFTTVHKVCTGQLTPDDLAKQIIFSSCKSVAITNLVQK